MIEESQFTAKVVLSTQLPANRVLIYDLYVLHPIHSEKYYITYQTNCNFCRSSQLISAEVHSYLSWYSG